MTNQERAARLRMAMQSLEAWVRSAQGDTDALHSIGERY